MEKENPAFKYLFLVNADVGLISSSVSLGKPEIKVVLKAMPGTFSLIFAISSSVFSLVIPLFMAFNILVDPCCNGMSK